MLRYATFTAVFLMSFAIAQAEEGQNYFGVSAIIDAKLDYDHPALYDINSDAGYGLSYGRQMSGNLAFEFAYLLYAKAGTSPAAAKTELSATEISVLLSNSSNGPFVRLGYSDGETKTELGDLRLSESESGPVYGVGFNIPMPNNAGVVRLEYNTVDYDNAEANRLTLGTIFKY